MRTDEFQSQENLILDLGSFSYREIHGQKSEWTPRQNPRNVTSSGNVNNLDDVIRVDCTAGAVVMTLESAMGCDGRQHTFKKIDASANAMTLDGAGSETIDGAATISTTVRYTTFVIKSNGTNWDLISAAVTSAPGTVTSVAQTFTGGLISVAGSPITTTGTLALTVAGTSGGVPYFSSGTAWASSAVLAASAIVLGGGAGNPPATTTTGTGVVTALGVAVGSAGAFVTFNGALGTPSSGTLTNATGLPIGSGVSGLGSNVSTFLATPSSANLASALTDELGSGKAVFGAAVTAWTPTVGIGGLTDNGSGYTTSGAMVMASFDVTWPTTIDGGAAEISSLPVTCNASYQGAAVFGYTDYGAAFTGRIVAGESKIRLYALTGVAITNISISGKRFIGTAMYPS